jgi:hypothetical protein
MRRGSVDGVLRESAGGGVEQELLESGEVHVERAAGDLGGFGDIGGGGRRARRDETGGGVDDGAARAIALGDAAGAAEG